MSPCGRIVDVLRSCYRADMQPYRDSNGKKRVVWYFVGPDNPPMPWASAFTSRVYDRKDEPPLPIGEQYAPVPWRGGLPPYNPPGPGLCGTREQWENGCHTSDPIPDNYPDSHVPICCGPPKQIPRGGIGYGGQAIVKPPPNLCVPPDPIPYSLCFSAEWIGPGSPSATPLYGIPPVYKTVLNWTEAIPFSFSWVSPGYNFPTPHCGGFTFYMSCGNTGMPFTLANLTAESPPGCGGALITTVPYGTLQTLELSPVEITFLPTVGSGVGWLYTVSVDPNCPLYSSCCPLGIGMTRTLTISGGGLSGSITSAGGYGINGVQWTFLSTTITGCGGTLFEAIVTCVATPSSAVWAIQFFQTCYTPGSPGQIYDATSWNCDLPEVEWIGLPGGVNIVMT